MQAIRVRGLHPLKQLLKEGVLTADGTEQTLIEASGLLSLEGYVDLSAMTTGDTVTLTRYVKIQQDGEYKRHATETYTGPQADPLVRFPFIAGYYGIKVTLKQTSGTYKTFPYQFFKEM
ncbi:MAG: hypothetical protein QXO00_02385 [Candidatus Bathyarchaeia archaeon]